MWVIAGQLDSVRGNESVYRSLVNLGEGPKLFDANLSMNSPLGSKQVSRPPPIQRLSLGRRPLEHLAALC
jgi:hypothetical protein